MRRTPNTKGPERLLSTEEVADMLGVPVSTVYWWRTRGEGPKGARIGRFVRFRPADVEAWIAQQVERDAPA